MTTEPDIWFEYDCPAQGIDFDVRPVPPFGSTIECSACGRSHVADDTLGAVWQCDDAGVRDVTVEWKANRP